MVLYQKDILVFDNDDDISNNLKIKENLEDDLLLISIMLRKFEKEEISEEEEEEDDDDDEKYDSNDDNQSKKWGLKVFFKESWFWFKG